MLAALLDAEVLGAHFVVDVEADAVSVALKLADEGYAVVSRRNRRNGWVSESSSGKSKHEKSLPIQLNLPDGEARCILLGA